MVETVFDAFTLLFGAAVLIGVGIFYVIALFEAIDRIAAYFGWRTAGRVFAFLVLIQLPVLILVAYLFLPPAPAKQA